MINNDEEEIIFRRKRMRFYRKEGIVIIHVSFPSRLSEAIGYR